MSLFSFGIKQISTGLVSLRCFSVQEKLLIIFLILFTLLKPDKAETTACKMR